MNSKCERAYLPVVQGSWTWGWGDPPTSELDDTLDPRKLVPVTELLFVDLGGSSGGTSLSLLWDDRRLVQAVVPSSAGEIYHIPILCNGH